MAPRFSKIVPMIGNAGKSCSISGATRGGGGAADWATAAVASSNTMTTASASVSPVRITDHLGTLLQASGGVVLLRMPPALLFAFELPRDLARNRRLAQVEGVDVTRGGLLGMERCHSRNLHVDGAPHVETAFRAIDVREADTDVDRAGLDAGERVPNLLNDTGPELRRDCETCELDRGDRRGARASICFCHTRRNSNDDAESHASESHSLRREPRQRLGHRWDRWCGNATVDGGAGSRAPFEKRSRSAATTGGEGRRRRSSPAGIRMRVRSR